MMDNFISEVEELILFYKEKIKAGEGDQYDAPIRIKYLKKSLAAAKKARDLFEKAMM